MKTIEDKAHDLACAVLTNESMLQRWIDTHIDELPKQMDIFDIYKILYENYVEGFSGFTA